MASRFTARGWAVTTASLASLVGFSCGELAAPLQPPDPAIAPPLLAAVDSVLSARPLQAYSTLALQFRPPREGALIFADSVLGRTFEWDLTTNAYALTARAGAPSRGVRAILYTLDGGFGADPLRPLVEAGHVDLIHERPATTTNLRSIVRGVGGVPTHGDYLVSAVLGTAAFDVTATGTFTIDVKRLGVRAHIAADNVRSVIDYTLDLPVRNLHIGSVVTSERTAMGRTATANFVLRHGGGAGEGGGAVIIMQGTVTETATATGAATFVADVTLWINGSVFATIRGADSDVRFLDEAGSPLIGDEALAVQRLFTAPDRLHLAIARLLQPPVNQLGGF